ncbi:MAG: ABC transporter permease [Clostridia bacterium]|nr:ABC transporter permease [Clostridia bacterium]
MRYKLDERLRGWREVYAFSALQSLKSKATKITTVIFCVIALFSLPVFTLIMDNDDAHAIDALDIKTIYYYDESGFSILDGMNTALEGGRLSGAEVIKLNSADYDRKILAMESAEYGEADILCHFLISNETGYTLRVAFPKSESVSELDANDAAAEIAAVFHDMIFITSGLPEDEISSLMEPIEYELITDYIPADGNDSTVDVGSDDMSEINVNRQGLTMAEYGVSYACILIVMIFVAIFGEMIATSVVTEKANRVTEYLLTSIRPLALIFGKVLAGLTVMLLQFATIAASLVCSVYIENAISGRDGLPPYLSQLFSEESIASFTPLRVILAVVVIIFGFLLYGTLAGLVGASVSRVEETTEGLKGFTFVLMIGCYLGLANTIYSMFDAGSLLFWLSMLLPISSPFVIPAYLLIGRVSTPIALGSLAVLMISFILLSIFVANVYEGMIFHNGSRLKLKDILQLSRKEAHHESK